MNHIRHRHRPPRHQKGDKRIFGFVVLMLGLFILFRRLDIFHLNFHDVWPWALILIGGLIGIKSRFQNNAWWVLVMIGTVHLIPVFTIFGVSSSALVLPLALVAGGLVLIFSPSRKKKPWNQRCEDSIKTVMNDGSTLNVDVTFGGHKEIVTSKDFKGGRVSTTFGGTEINLMNAVAKEKTVPLHFQVTFAGVELIVPSHWELKNEISNTLASVEDNRNIRTHTGDEEVTTLVLTGNCNFGSIEIKSY